MTTEQQAIKYLRDIGNFDIKKEQISPHLKWAVINLPLIDGGPNFATFYDKKGLLDFAISQGFTTT